MEEIVKLLSDTTSSGFEFIYLTLISETKIDSVPMSSIEGESFEVKLDLDKSSKKYPFEVDLVLDEPPKKYLITKNDILKITRIRHLFMCYLRRHIYDLVVYLVKYNEIQLVRSCCQIIRPPSGGNKCVLHYATDGHYEILKMLIEEFKMDVDLRTPGGGNTPLQYCVTSRDDKEYKCLKYLLEQEADVNAVDFDGNSVEWHAKKSQNAQTILPILYSYGLIRSDDLEQDCGWFDRR